MSPASNIPLLKGYLPVRLLLPPTWTNEYHDETYFYVREHQSGKGRVEQDASEGTQNNNSNGKKSTLFVANAPIVPGISTKILLQSIFGRFTDLSRVTVVKNPRGAEDESGNNSLVWTEKFRNPTFLPPTYSEGKFAHIVFETPKAMKKALRALQDAMKRKKDKSIRPGLVLEKIEIQTLADESSRIHRQERRMLLGLGDDDDDDDDNDNENADLRDAQEIADDQAVGIHAIIARYQSTRAELSRERLMEECNAVMQGYEDAEDEKRRAKDAARAQPDEDGFVTVNYSSAVGSQIDLETTKHATGNSGTRRKGNMRSRKKKDAHGAKELPDFYRFQRRDNKKRTLEDLRHQFAEDLARVKRMKEERHYRPF